MYRNKNKTLTFKNTKKMAQTIKVNFKVPNFDALMLELDAINFRYFTDEMWNDANQKEREEMAKPACFAFTLNHKEMTKRQWEQFFDYLEDINCHTERKLFKKILGM